MGNTTDREQEYRTKLRRRVVRAAEADLADHHHVTPVEVLMGIGWLPPSSVDLWRQGRLDHLEREVGADSSRISTAMAFLRDWARGRDLEPAETAYLARSRDRRPLRFSESGEPAIERAYRTHWLSRELPDAKRQRLVEKQSRPPDLVVIWALNEWTCSECGDDSGGESGGLLVMEGPGPLCMRCADLDHLVFLPAGDAALTRRAKKASRLSAVVVRFSRSRKRYERQGILVEDEALTRAERECLADEAARRARREREAARRAEQDVELQAAFAREITRLFPGCPPARAKAIAHHAATPRSGRVGRSAAGRALDPDAVEPAVAAAVRHGDTRYDELLMSAVPRAEARDQVRSDVHRVLDAWRSRA
ncbi:MAG: DUF2293 domain-containing protein [Acidimicrobiales bacterium]